MSSLRIVGRVMGTACIAIGALQLAGGVRAEPGMSGDATTDSHVRFMGAMFAGYGLGWLDASARSRTDLGRMRILAALMAAGGLGRLITRASLGRPHRFHDVLLAIELATPIAVEVAARVDHRDATGRSSGVA